MGLGGGVECEAHLGYHLREADLYFEIIDPNTGRLVPAGEYGEVVFSTLTRRGMPLIRYRLGDRCRFLPGRCPCGSGLRLMERVSGRFEGYFSFEWEDIKNWLILMKLCLLFRTCWIFPCSCPAALAGKCCRWMFVHLKRKNRQ